MPKMKTHRGLLNALEKLAAAKLSGRVLTKGTY